MNDCFFDFYILNDFLSENNSEKIFKKNNNSTLFNNPDSFFCNQFFFVYVFDLILRGDYVMLIN